MTEPGTDADLRLPPKYVPLTHDEVAWLRGQPEGPALEITEAEGLPFLALRGDGAARWALESLRLRRVMNAPGTVHPPVDINYAGSVLRRIVAERMAADRIVTLDVDGPWLRLPRGEREEWQALAEQVWDAQTFGHGPDHAVPEGDDDDA